MVSCEGTPSPRIRVHDAALYTEIMNAADWSRTIKREQDRRQLALRQLEAEQAQAQESKKLEKAHLLAARDAATAEARLQLQLREDGQRQEMLQFRRRISDFMREHEELLTRCALVRYSTATHKQQVLASLSRAWEDDVLRPVQESIDAQLRDVREEKRRTALRHEMLSSFLSECNIASRRSGRHAVFRDLIDEVQYNPLQQLCNSTIRYPAPPKKKIAVDVHRQEAQDVQRRYVQLALDYRGLDRESTTGVLSAQPPRTESSVLPASLSAAEFHSRGVRSFDTTMSICPLDTTSVGQPAGVDSRNGLLGPPGIISATSGNTIAPEAVTAVMPLPLVRGVDTEGHDALALWLQVQRAPQPRSHYLPVTAWNRFTETVHGWKATADGNVKPSSDRAMESAWRRGRSNVILDHYTYPRGPVEPLHTGKRVV